MLLSNDDIQKLADTIAGAVKPEKIILFGSYRTGEATEESDVDLFVVARSKLPRGKRASHIRRLFRGAGIPMDILVYTPEEVAYWKDTPASLVAQVMAQGKVLYGRQN
ncbi:nucleotidyltransferase domain-containing protein [bacterium]|nr:nucleotidyltransferase domain-containing protein [bacterium]